MGALHAPNVDAVCLTYFKNVPPPLASTKINFFVFLVTQKASSIIIFGYHRQCHIKVGAVDAAALGPFPKFHLERQCFFGSLDVAV